MVCAVCSAPSLSTPAQSEPLPHLSDSANQLHFLVDLDPKFHMSATADRNDRPIWSCTTPPCHTFDVVQIRRSGSLQAPVLALGTCSRRELVASRPPHRSWASVRRRLTVRPRPHSCTALGPPAIQLATSGCRCPWTQTEHSGGAIWQCPPWMGGHRSVRFRRCFCV